MADISKATGTGAGARPARRWYQEHSKVADATVARGDWVYVKSNGRVAPARANAAGTSHVFGVAVSAGVQGDTVTVVQRGTVTGWASLTPGTLVYLSAAVAGAGADAAPAGGGGNYLAIVGIANSASEIEVCCPAFATAIA